MNLRKTECTSKLSLRRVYIKVIAYIPGKSHRFPDVYNVVSKFQHRFLCLFFGCCQVIHFVVVAFLSFSLFHNSPGKAVDCSTPHPTTLGVCPYTMTGRMG